MLTHLSFILYVLTLNIEVVSKTECRMVNEDHSQE